MSVLDPTANPLVGALGMAECVNSMTWLWLKQKEITQEERAKRTARFWSGRRGYIKRKLRGVGMTAALRPGEFRPRLEAVSEMSGGVGGRGGETISMAAVPEGATPLMYACQQSRVTELANMINAKPGNIRDRDRTLKTALHYCAENQKPDCAELLVTSAPDLVDARDEDGYTPLHLAVIAGNIPFLRFLLARGASLAALDNERHSVVHWATVCGELEALETVLGAGAEASSADMHGGYPVHYAAQMCGPGGGAEAAGGGDKSVGMAVLTTLLEHKVPVNVTDKDGRQPILWAASAGSADAILALVNAGANVEADDKDGLTALHCAASRGHTECLETLITLCGAQVDLMDSNGCTALFYAATLGHADATHLLLTLNAQPNRQDRKGRTPAHCGAAKGQLETLRLLSEHTADLWLRNAKGDYALHEAVASGRKELVTWLLAQRPDAVNAANNDGRQPLHIAAIYNNVQMCKILLDAESLVNPVTRSSKGQLMTPLDAALYKGNRGCAKYLQLHGGVPATKLTPEAAALRGVANKTEIEQREARSRGTTPDMLNVPKGGGRGGKEPRSLQTSPVTITGNKQLTLVDASHNSHILQVHVQDQLSVMGDESQEVSESGADRRTKKRRHKRHSRRTDDDDYASGDSDSRDRRRRRRRDEESSEEDEDELEDGEEEEEGSGSRGGRKRRGGRRERERTDGSDYESDESEHSRRGRRRRDKNRRGKKERRSLRRERSDDLNDGDDQKRRSTKGRERKRVIKEETKRSEIIKSKKVIEESMDDDETPQVTKSSITTSQETKEQTLKTVSEVIDGEEVPNESEKTGEERVIQVVEAEVHQEQQNEEDAQDGRASKTETQTDDQGESTTAEGEPLKKGNRKSKLKKMDKEEITSKQSESQKSESAAAASAAEDDNEAAERAAKLEEQRKSEEEEEERMRQEEERKKQEEERRRQEEERKKQEEERRRQEEEEEKRRSEEEEERKRQEEEEEKRRSEEEEERKRQEEEEEKRRSEEEEERKAQEEAERLAREEAERKAKEEAERRAREEAERIAREEAERKAREEAEEAERKAREEAERIAKEEAEKKAREEAERKAQEEAERKALEEKKHGRMAVEVKKYEDVTTVIENMKGDADKAGDGNEPVTEEEINKTIIQTTESAPPQEVVESDDTGAARSEVSMLKTPRSPSVQSSPRTPETATPRRRSNRLAAEFKKYEDVKTVVGNMKNHVQVANGKHDRMAVEVKKYEDVKTVIENMKGDGEEEYEEEEQVVKKSPRRGKAKDGERKKVRSKSRDRKEGGGDDGEAGGVQRRKASGKKKGVRVNEGGKTKREVSVAMDKIVDESDSKAGGNEEEQEDEEEEEDEEFYSDKSMSGDEESVDLDPGRALVKIIGRAREEREPRSRRRRRKMSGDRPARARSSFSVVSDSLSTHLDSGFEPSPRNDRINEARDRRRDRSAGPELTPASVTQAVQHSIRRYHLERRIFHELLELKRLQIRAGRSNEAVLVKRLAEEYRKAALDVGLIPYQGPFSFRTFENYLYDQLRKLQIAERKMVPKLQSNDELERLTAALRKTRAGKAFLESVPDSPAYCTHSTHRCSHATHAYTGIPCAAYITKANHHTVPKPPRSGFLPKIEAPDKRSKEGQSAEIARCLRYVDPSRPVTLELSHGKDRQVISLPTENLDKNKRYYVTFTIKGGESASETTGDERKHRHAKSF